MILCANVLTPETKAVPDMLAYTGPLEKVLPRLKDLGYGGVEFITVDPKSVDVSRLDRLLAEHGLAAAAVNTGRICGELGLNLGDPDAAVRGKALARMRDAVDFAANWRVPVNVGIVRGNYRADVPRDLTYRLAVESLRALCDHAAERGVPLAIETVCFLQTNFVNTLAEAADLIRDVGHDSLGVMYDLFQMYIEERDLEDAIARYMPLCRHVHFADSNRRAPGEGAMDYVRLVSRLREAGYDGPAAVEIRPVPDQDSAARAAAEHLLPLL